MYLGTLRALFIGRPPEGVGGIGREGVLPADLNRHAPVAGVRHPTYVLLQSARTMRMRGHDIPTTSWRANCTGWKLLQALSWDLRARHCRGKEMCSPDAQFPSRL
jgi:hypothetical protein